MPPLEFANSIRLEEEPRLAGASVSRVVNTFTRCLSAVVVSEIDPLSG
ncbi:hypothetical protein [Spirosoma arcticum]